MRRMDQTGVEASEYTVAVPLAEHERGEIEY